MRRLLALMVLVLAFSPAAARATTLPDIEDEVMCVTCGTVLEVSEAPAADGERQFIRNRIAEGKTKAEIKRLMVVEYGPRVLATPRDKSWVVPILLAILALGTVGITVRRWRDSALPEPVAPALADEDAERLDADMKAYDR